MASCGPSFALHFDGNGDAVVQPYDSLGQHVAGDDVAAA